MYIIDSTLNHYQMDTNGMINTSVMLHLKDVPVNKSELKIIFARIRIWKKWIEYYEVVEKEERWV